jgi:hypothetical protein
MMPDDVARKYGLTPWTMEGDPLLHRALRLAADLNGLRRSDVYVKCGFVADRSVVASMTRWQPDLLVLPVPEFVRVTQEAVDYLNTKSPGRVPCAVAPAEGVSMSDSPGDRARVYTKIAPLIRAFGVLHAGETFHVEDLRMFVMQHEPDIAPDSPGRILRALRQEGHLDYIVVNRRDSLYQFGCQIVCADIGDGPDGGGGGSCRGARRSVSLEAPMTAAEVVAGLVERFAQTRTRADHWAIVSEPLFYRQVEWLKANQRDLYYGTLRPAAAASWRRTDPDNAQGAML